MGDVIPFESICFVNHNINYETIQVNDIIAFRYGEMLVTHRVVAITDDGMITQGDSNESKDLTPVTKENYIGKTVFAIPNLGYFLTWAFTLRGKYILIGIAFFIFIAGFFYRKETKV